MKAEILFWQKRNKCYHTGCCPISFSKWILTVKIFKLRSDISKCYKSYSKSQRSSKCLDSTDNNHVSKPRNVQPLIWNMLWKKLLSTCQIHEHWFSVRVCLLDRKKMCMHYYYGISFLRINSVVINTSL